MKLPHPATIFLGAAVLIIVVGWDDKIQLLIGSDSITEIVCHFLYISARSFLLGNYLGYAFVYWWGLRKASDATRPVGPAELQELCQTIDGLSPRGYDPVKVDAVEEAVNMMLVERIIARNKGK